MVRKCSPRNLLSTKELIKDLALCDDNAVMCDAFCCDVVVSAVLPEKMSSYCIHELCRLVVRFLR